MPKQTIVLPSQQTVRVNHELTLTLLLWGAFAAWGSPHSAPLAVEGWRVAMGTLSVLRAT